MLVVRIRPSVCCTAQPVPSLLLLFGCYVWTLMQHLRENRLSWTTMTGRERVRALVTKLVWRNDSLRACLHVCVVCVLALLCWSYSRWSFSLSHTGDKGDWAKATSGCFCGVRVQLAGSSDSTSWLFMASVIVSWPLVGTFPLPAQWEVSILDWEGSETNKWLLTVK